MSEFDRFERMAQALGLTARDCGNGHWQARGVVLVNYYPTSKDRSIFVSGTSKAVEFGGWDAALGVAKNGPARGRLEDRMSVKRARAERRRLLARDPHCWWCRRPLDAQTATLEHVVPLARGGTNRRENLALACKKCNADKADRVGAPNQ